LSISSPVEIFEKIWTRCIEGQLEIGAAYILLAPYSPWWRWELIFLIEMPNIHWAVSLYQFLCCPSIHQRIPWKGISAEQNYTLFCCFVFLYCRLFFEGSNSSASEVRLQKAIDTHLWHVVLPFQLSSSCQLNCIFLLKIQLILIHVRKCLNILLSQENIMFLQ